MKNKINYKKTITLIGLSIGVILFLGVLLFFLLRNYFLTKAIDKISAGIENKYHLTLKINKAGFTDFAEVTLHNISLAPPNPDTLVCISNLVVKVSALHLLLADVRIKKIAIADGYIHLLKKNGYKNFQTLLSPADTGIINTKDDTKTEKLNIAETGYRLIEKILNKVPDYLELKNITFKVTDEDRFVYANIPLMLLAKSKLTASVKITDNLCVQHWIISGMANTAAKSADIVLTSADSSGVRLPYLNNRFNLLLGFDSVRLFIHHIDLNDDILQINGLASTKNLVINHPKIASENVGIAAAEFTFDINAGADFIELDSSSKVIFNGLNIFPFAKIQRNNQLKYWFNIKTDEEVTAQEFIDALPNGMFKNVRGMQATGTFFYRLQFMLDEANPEGVVFNSELKKNNLHITQYGNANLAKLNSDFIHYPIENGRVVRSVLVSPENTDFTPLANISEYLKKAILTNEDPSFFYHRGFVTDAFKQSIVKNLRTGKFKRGASTISMQLVKNVFLTREKTMARKLEEILLVYILENNYLVSKDRMLEVYLNIIEWGPNVYGIGEASRFYFNKKPNQLTLSESLFLASIIPSPKKFMWRFDGNGVARSWLWRSFRFIANKMISREMILPQDTTGLTHLVQITGNARKFIVKNDSLLNDSLVELQLENNTDD